MKYTSKLANSLAKEYRKGEATIDDICEGHNIDTSTWFDWLNEESPRFKFEFSKLIKDAKEERVSLTEDFALDGLKKLVKGYEYEEVTTVIDPNAPDDSSKIKEVRRTKKQVKPDKTLVMFVLTNRDKKNWKHRSQIDLGNTEDRPLKVLNIDLDDVKDLDASSLKGLFDD